METCLLKMLLHSNTTPKLLKQGKFSSVNHVSNKQTSSQMVTDLNFESIFCCFINDSTSPYNSQFRPKGVINDYKEFQKTGATPGQITPTDVETDENSDLSDLDDDEAFEEYRQQRLNEMLLTQAVITTTETRSKAIYDLDADNYVEQQESSGNGKISRLITERVLFVCRDTAVRFR